MPEKPGVDTYSASDDKIEESASVAPEESVRQEHGDVPVDSPSHQTSIVDRPSAVVEHPPPLKPLPNAEAKSSVESVDTLKPPRKGSIHGPEKHIDLEDMDASKNDGPDQNDRHDASIPSHGSAPSPQPSVIISRPATPIKDLDETQVQPPQEPSTPFNSLGLLNNASSPQASRPPTSDPATTRPVSVPGFSSSHVDALQLLEHVTSHTYISPGHVARSVHPPMIRGHSSQSPSRSQSAISEVLAGGETRTALIHPSVETPSPSPGLQSPTVQSPLSAKKSGTETNDGRPSSRVLQNPPTRKEPEETNKLNKRYDQTTGRKHLNNYELFEPKLGSGQHGTVKRGKNMETGEPVAVKIVRRFSKRVRLGKTGDPNDSIKKEVAILKKARHPHVVGLYEVIDDPEYDKVYLVLEFVERSEIVWRKPTEKSIANFEKDRCAREVAYGFDPYMEGQAVDGFNLGAAARITEKRETHEMQRRRATEMVLSGNYQRPGSALSHSQYSEDFDAGSRLAYRQSSHDLIRKSRADQHEEDHPSEPPQSATPMISTTSAHSYGHFLESPCASHPGTAPSSAFNSGQNSRRNSIMASLEGTQYGPYIDPNSDLDERIQRQYQILKEAQAEEWTPEEEYFRHVPCLTLPQASDAFRDTVLGIEYLHYQGIIHRDIKPANLLWTEKYRVKISDFGVSYLGKPMRGESEHDDLPPDAEESHDETLELAKTVGTPAFYAPELCDPDIFDPEKKAAQRPTVTGQIDVWALGVTLYCMVYGRLPFYDSNEFRMYEKIAREELFIPMVRFKGVSHTDKTPSNQYKRLDEIIEYEEVDDTLRDLLKRLLIKDPAKRITLTEVKHHPWVVSSIEKKEEWLAVTDPSRQSEGKKIEVSTQEVQEAVVGLNLLGRIVEGVSRFVRGSSQRKRNNSNPKLHERAPSTASHFNDGRRGSLREDQQILAALKHQKDGGHKEGGEHPLSHSVAASPGATSGRDYFGLDDEEQRPHSAIEGLHAHRPSIAGSSMSTADSMRTITGREPFRRQSIIEPQQSNSAEDLASTTHSLDQGSSSSLGGIFSGASRRIVNTFRSRERGLNGNSPSETSRSSSIDRTSRNLSAEDYHGTPSLGYSSAIAAGHVDLPASLREEGDQYSLPNESSAESLPQRHASNIQQRRRQMEAARRGAHRRSISYASGTHIAPLEDDIPLNQPRPMSAAESSFAISSSSDQIVSSESTAHSRIPSIVSRASSVSAPIEEDPKRFIPQAWPKTIPSPPSAADLEQTISADPAIAKARAQQEEEAGYNGEAEEQDSDSEDEGLAMA